MRKHWSIEISSSFYMKSRQKDIGTVTCQTEDIAKDQLIFQNIYCKGKNKNKGVTKMKTDSEEFNTELYLNLSENMRRNYRMQI